MILLTDANINKKYINHHYVTKSNDKIKLVILLEQIEHVHQRLYTPSIRLYKISVCFILLSFVNLYHKTEIVTIK